MTNKDLKIGMIGLDTSHVTAFTKLLNDQNNEYHVPGGKVVVAFPGGSSDMKVSYTRVEGFTKEIQEKYDVQILDSIKAVGEQSDVILLESVDGRVHLEQFREIAFMSKPTFIDKPFTINHEEAKEIFRLADSYNTPVMSCSALRYAEGLTKALEQSDSGSIIGVDCYGPLTIDPTHGLFWYGIHTVEMLYRAFGTGCKKICVTKNDNHDLIVAEWADGRIGSLRGNRQGNSTFGALIHREKGSQFVDVYSDPKPYYASLLDQIMIMFKTGKPTIDSGETLEIIRFIEAANESRETGKTVTL